MRKIVVLLVAAGMFFLLAGPVSAEEKDKDTGGGLSSIKPADKENIDEIIKGVKDEIEKLDKEKKDKEEKDKKDKKDKDKSEGNPPPYQKPPQEAAPAGQPVNSGFDGTFGAVSIDGKMYYMLAFLYELGIDKFAAGFDVRLTWNDDGLKKDDWNDWQKAISNMFRYIRYGQKGDSFYAKLGILDNSTLGHGFIMRRYSNIGADLYTRRFGTELDVNFGGFGIETVTNDINWERLVGGRLYLKLIPEFLEIGATVVYDKDPTFGKYTLDPQGNHLVLVTQSPFVEYGADIGIPLIKGNIFSMLVYGDWAKVKDKGQGFVFPGFAGKALIFDYRFEYRILDSDFIPGLFDNQYEDRRPVSWAGYVTGGPQVKGFFGELGWKLMNWLRVCGSYEKSEGGLPSVRGEITYTGNFIPRITEAAAGYEQREIVTLDLKNPNTVVYARVGLMRAPGASMVFTTRQTYDALIGDYNRSTIMAMQMKF